MPELFQVLTIAEALDRLLTHITPLDVIERVPLLDALDRITAEELRAPGELCADPVFGKSNLIYTMTHADGILRVPLDRAGLYAGDQVTVRLF